MLVIFRSWARLRYTTDCQTLSKEHIVQIIMQLIVMNNEKYRNNGWFMIKGEASGQYTPLEMYTKLSCRRIYKRHFFLTFSLFW